MATTHSTPTGDTAAARPYLDQIDRLKGELPGAALSRVRELRRDGRERFAALGVPTVRQEAWKYTSLRPLEKVAFEPATAAAAAGTHIDVLPTVRPAGQTGPRLVFVNGRLRADLSSTDGLPDGVVLTGLADALSSHADFVGERLGRLANADEHPLVALNTAVLADGPVLHIPRGVVLDDPIELVFVSAAADGRATVFHPRTLIVADPLSKAVVIEHHVGPGGAPTFANHTAEVFVGEGATLRHYKVQREQTDAFHVSHAAATVCRDACYDNFILTSGARLSRNEVHAVLDGTGASCHVSGAYLVTGEQHCDTTTLIDHARPYGTSREVYKGAIDERARAVFQGKIIVRPGAQKTDGHQLNRALLLSDTAEIDSKPELEIYADDVKCSHGATAGELDDEALFYLRSRGIPKEEARGLLIASFLAEAIDEIPEEPVRDAFAAIATGWLAARRGGAR
ncbi:Fe-S cluster assembly protein SufD [Azospirillum halopraeferens]|uniref:Fe-S cluster assembly protein SufD n=1 Tax=Azospirillum halopraeferens TaxID=34010 RepID=UPI0004072EDE|nr:Fe-S cluster assembly protein SufD [Azospirillum halopraeferens]